MNYIPELKNTDNNKTYLLAVSGGVDSMVMADLFRKQGFSIHVAHCNFSLRGEESDLDEQLVKNWCENNQIPFHTKRFDTTAYAAEHSLSIQECARELRYAFFYKLLETEKTDLIVTAHHVDDNIETLLFHFLRGTGIQGLTGIPAKGDRLVRPMLHITKENILQYAMEFSVPFRNDSSNLKETYTRNKIRHSVVPFLEERFPNMKHTLADNINRFKDVNEIYQNAISSILKKLIEKRENDLYIPILKLKKTTPLQTITYELIKPFQFNFQQAVELLKLMDGQSGTYIQSSTHKIIRDRDFFIITALDTPQSGFILIEKETERVRCRNFELIFKPNSGEKKEINTDPNTEMVDASLLKYPLILRTWKQGDYLYPFGMDKKKKVARVLIDAKLSLPEKEEVWVLESERKIVWIIGIKPDNRFRVTEKTKTILHLQCFKNKQE